MSLKSTRTVLALALACAACSDRSSSPPPQAEWVLGVYSTLEPSSLSTDSLTQFHFEAESVARIVNVDLSPPFTETSHSWESRDERTVAIVDLEGYSDDPEILVFRSEGCEPLTYRHVREDGYEATPAPLYRGEVCVRMGDPDVIGGSYETYWCDEPPEPCEDGG